MYASGYEIKDLKGVEHFRELKRLYCIGNQLTTLNLSGNTKLLDDAGPERDENTAYYLDKLDALYENYKPFITSDLKN